MCYKPARRIITQKELSRVQLQLALIPKSYLAFRRASTRAIPAITRSQELSRVRESYHPFNVRSECAICRCPKDYHAKRATTSAVGASAHPKSYPAFRRAITRAMPAITRSQELSRIRESYHPFNVRSECAINRPEGLSRRKSYHECSCS